MKSTLELMQFAFTLRNIDTKEMFRDPFKILNKCVLTVLKTLHVDLNKLYFTSGYVGILVLNLIVSLVYFGASLNSSVTNSSGVTFGLSILYLVLYTPCSFVFWYRPVYNAFRSVCRFSCQQGLVLQDVTVIILSSK